MSNSVDRHLLEDQNAANSVEKCSTVAHGKHCVLGGLSIVSAHCVFEMRT